MVRGGAQGSPRATFVAERWCTPATAVRTRDCAATPCAAGRVGPFLQPGAHNLRRCSRSAWRWVHRCPASSWLEWQRSCSIYAGPALAPVALAVQVKLLGVSAPAWRACLACTGGTIDSTTCLNVRSWRASGICGPCSAERQPDSLLLLMQLAALSLGCT